MKMVLYVMDTSFEGLVYIFLLEIHMNSVVLCSFFVQASLAKFIDCVLDYRILFQFIIVRVTDIYLMVLLIYSHMLNHFLSNLVKNEFHEHKLQIIVRELWVFQIFKIFEEMIHFNLFFQLHFESWILFKLFFLATLIPFMKFFLISYQFQSQNSWINFFCLMISILYLMILEASSTFLFIYLDITAIRLIQHHEEFRHKIQ